MKSFRYFIFLAIFFGLIGCSDINEAFTDGYNKDPNAIDDSPPEELFIGAQTGSIQYFEGESARLSSMWTRFATGANKKYSGYNSYNIGALDFDFPFSLVYSTIRSNLELVKEKAKDSGGKENLIGVSNIMESMVMGSVTALWGNIPYSEANKPDITEPHYDEQTQVYKMIQANLDDALSLLENNKNDLPADVDILSYNGDINKWIKVANTLRARFYMHVGDYEQAISYAQKGLMDLNGGDDLAILHGTVIGGDANIYYGFITGNRQGYLSASENENHALPLLNSRNNTKTDESGRIDFYYGGTTYTLNTNSNGAFGRSTSFPLVTAVENYLILAESYARRSTNNDDETALNYLNKARQYNENKFPGSTYQDLSLSDFEPGGEYEDTTVLQEIFDEEYLSLAFQIEAFNFVRRINYQVTGLQPVSGRNKFPERFLYPQRELNSNKNVPSQDQDALFTATPVNKN